MLELKDCLSQEDCIEVLDTLHKLKDLWTPRMGSLPFYTLGTASYLDAGGQGEVYYKIQSKKTNLILQENFPQLYEKVAQTLAQVTGLDVVYEPQFALPGFHIFQYSELFEHAIASFHFDLQHEELFWKYRNIEFNNPLSFTLALKLPSSGGGLLYWDIYYPEVKHLPKEEIEIIKDNSEEHFLPYQQGKMAVHNGFMLHQIAPAVEMKPNDERITLQGHGLICDKVLHVYW